MITENLEIFLNHIDIPISRLEKNLNLGNGTLAKAVKNKKNIGSDILEKIFSHFPFLNLEWLFTGKGSMILNERNTESSSSTQELQESPTSYNKLTDEQIKKHDQLLFDEYKKLIIENFKLENELEKANEKIRSLSAEQAFMVERYR